MKECIAQHIDVTDPTWYRALTLQERLATLPASTPTGEYSERAKQQLQRWQHIDAFQKGGNFAARLSADGMTEDDLLRLLDESSASIQQRMPVPDWLEQLAEIVEHTDIPTPMPTPMPTSILTPTAANDQQENLTLLNTVDLFVQYGKDRLSRDIAVLSEQYTTLPFDLSQLALLFLPNLVSSFQFVNRTMVLELNVARLQDRLHGASAQERFQDFVRQTRQKDGLLPLLQEYPVLARLLVNAVNRWHTYAIEFLTHLCNDWPIICTTFFAGHDPGPLVEVSGGAGDMHRGGRSVLTLRFACGQQLVYKPKSLAIDCHFQELLSWLNARAEQENLPLFRTLTLIDRGDYGWSEFVEASGCTNESEIAHFYERQGAYLALLYALDATDFHFENLIASGDQPVLIDLEALFHARVSTTPLDVAFDCVTYSVMRVGLLPNRVFSHQPGRSLDISGLGGREGQKTPIPVMNWEDAQTDQMHVRRDYRTLPGKHNRPKLDQHTVDPLAYRQAIATGFTRMYHLLMTQRDELCRGPLAHFAHDEVRCILRATNFYAHLLSESFHPELLSDALDRDRHFDYLWISIEHNQHLTGVIPWEHADLLVGDIPMFTGTPASCDLISSGGQQQTAFFAQSSLQVTTQTLYALDERDMERQRWFIHASFTSMLMGKGAPLWQRPSVSSPAGKGVTRARLLEAACAIGDRLCDLALGDEQDERGVNWVGLSLVDERQWLLTSANPDLYSGNAGIILFLSYLGHITGEPRYSQMVEAAYITMHKQVQHLRGQLQTIGAFDGWGSVIYVLTHLGILWNDATLLEEAQQVVELLPDLIEQDRMFDLLSGSAGCIMSLLGLYQVTHNPAVLDAAICCGEHLLSTAMPQEQGVGWLNPAASQKPLTGFSHGAASYALSLFALARASGQQRFHDLALQALRYERSVFSSKAQNWPDYRLDDDDEEETVLQGEKYMVAWCHGAPGIGLGRMAILDYLDEPLLYEEIAIALRLTISDGFGLNHSLCHGDLGNLETLLVASQKLPAAQRPQYTQRLHYFSELILDSIEQDGWLTGIPLGIEAPGLMTGLAGIGYELLRLLDPEHVPSVLLVAPPALAEIVE